jgi:phage tail sheath protein FI
MPYEHGISLVENPTSIQQPVESYSAVQVVIGTAPINLAEDISAVVNKPVVARTFDEAKRKLGYSDDWSNYTLCEVMDASFKQFKVTPLIFINVLDPSTHKTNVPSTTVTIADKEALINDIGVLLDTLKVTDSTGATTYVKGTDYVVAFDDLGKPLISVLSTGTIGSATELKVTYDKLNTTAVTSTDIIGGYDSATNTYKGAELIQTIFPTLGIVPNTILAPGYSHQADVGAILVAKSTNINGSFKATNVLDVTGKTKEEAVTNKETNGFNDNTSYVCWPKAKIGDKVYHFSSIVAATIARTDAENDGVPYKSPSNKKIPISSMVNDDGEEVFLDQIQGNVLNGNGIVTAVNMGGWRTWGNNTAAYTYDPLDATIPDPKDRFIAVRRMFDWWGNTFIQAYFDKVDDSTNYRLIESLVDSENIRANGFQARGQIAGAKIEFRQADNPINQIMGGKISFIQKVAFFTPAEVIENVLEFDPTILADSLFGGE